MCNVRLAAFKRVATKWVKIAADLCTNTTPLAQRPEIRILALQPGQRDDALFGDWSSSLSESIISTCMIWSTVILRIPGAYAEASEVLTLNIRILTSIFANQGG